MCTSLPRFVVILSIVLSILGGLSIITATAFYHISTSLNIVLPDLIIGAYIVGSVLFFLGIIGSIAMQSTYCLMHFLYIMGLLLILGAEIYLTVLAFQKSADFDPKEFWNKADDNVKKAIQEGGKCCGYDSTSEAVKPCEYSRTCNYQFGQVVAGAQKVLKWILLTFSIFQLINLLCACYIAGVDIGKRKGAQKTSELLQHARYARRP